MLIENIKQVSNMYLKKEIVYKPKTLKDKAAIKMDAKENLVIKVNSVPLDGDYISLSYINAIVNLANFNFNKFIANGMSNSDAYKKAYKQTISWKGADNKIHNIQIETLVKALERIMKETSKIIGIK